jgi:hypothetical protein
MIMNEIHNDSRAASDEQSDVPTSFKENKDQRLKSNETPKVDGKMITDTPFFAMEKIQNKLNG